MSNEIIVSISVVTYNHKDYIKQCLDGILMQETNFLFEIILGEDESSDGTREICIEYADNYPDIIKLFLRKREDVIYINKKPTGRFNFAENLKVSKGKYIALCEGDDYWTDPLKLQKQVDFLEANSEYSICWTKYDKVDCLGNLIDKNAPKFDLSLADVTVANFFKNYRTSTLTTVFKASVLKKHDFSKFKYSKDNTLFFAAINDSKGRVLNFNSACYRIHDSGIWSASTDLNRYLADFYNYNEIKNKIVNTSSLENIIKQNLNDIVKSMIGYKNYRLISMNVFNECFFPVLTKLPIKTKIRFLKWYLIKFWNIYKPNFIKEH